MRASLDIEPGLIPIFRLFNLVMVILLALGLPTSLASNPPNVFSLAMLGMCAVLLLYLSWGALHRALGKYWLPLALCAASLAPILAEAAANRLYIARAVTDPTLLDPGRLYLWLLIPLLLISAQYGLRSLLFFNVGTALLPVLLALPSAASLDLNIVISNAAVRLILYTVAGYIVMRITSAARRQRHELAEKNRQLALYASTLEQLAIARERNRLARELHDTLAHTLSAVNVQLKALDVLLDGDPTAARATLAQTQELTRTGLQEARRSLQALRARPIDELGIGLALGELARRAAERAGLALTLDVPAQIDGLSEAAEQNLYRIAEEALNNIVRHANARSLLLRWRAGVLTIQDDGAGFDTAAHPNGHYGLVGMKERALLMDADLKIESREGHGTNIRLELKDKS